MRKEAGGRKGLHVVKLPEAVSNTWKYLNRS
jgi:hypothetical protein